MLLPDVCVVGLGRVGLPIAALAARAGQRVVGVERDEEVRAIAQGMRGSPEPGLSVLVREVVQSGRLTFETSPVPARISVLAVGTPLAADRGADIRDLDCAIAQIDAVAPASGLVVLASTVPVGTTERAARTLRALAPGRRIACCPERVLPGDVLREMVENPRLAGGVDAESTEAAALWLASFVTGPVLRVDSRMAELAKLVENAARDVDLALANTAAALALRHGLDPHALRRVVNEHPRVELLVPGIGVGGHCLPVDPWFLVEGAGEETRLLAVAREVNDQVPERWIERISQEAQRIGGRIGLLGLTYKADTDDVRQSPALQIARALSLRFDVVVHDPFLSSLEGVRLAPLQQVMERELVVLLVAHREYQGLQHELGHAVVLDSCGGWR